MKVKINKKELLMTIIAVVTLIALVAGATYAYFAVGTDTSEFTTQNINATAESIGGVILTKTGNGLNLNLSRVNMMQENANTYYVVEDASGTPVTSKNEVTIGTASVTGKGYYTCTYSLIVSNANSSAENNMYTSFQNWKTSGYSENGKIVSAASDATEGQIVLKVGGTEYDFYNANIFNTKATGTLSNLTSSNPGLIKAYMYVKNESNKNQNAIAGTAININITVDSFNCTAVNEPTYTYWTYEGSNVSYATATPKYTESQKSSIPNNYYVKTTPHSVVAETDIYEIQSESMGNSGVTFNSEEECKESITSMNVSDGICEVKYAKDETYEVTTHEVCGVFNNTEICMAPNTWSNASTYKSQFEAAGGSCIVEGTLAMAGNKNNINLLSANNMVKLYSNNLTFKNDHKINVVPIGSPSNPPSPPSSSSLTCTDSTNSVSCGISEDGYVFCAGSASCGVYPDLVWCGRY